MERQPRQVQVGLGGVAGFARGAKVLRLVAPSRRPRDDMVDPHSLERERLLAEVAASPVLDPQIEPAEKGQLCHRAGHRSMATTKRYIHLAGRVFRQEAEQLEKRLLGGDVVPKFVPDSENLNGSAAVSDGVKMPNPTR